MSFSVRLWVAFVLALCGASTDTDGQTRRPVGEEWNQVRPLFALVEQTAAGHPPSSDLILNWQCHFLNADAGVVFVPFTLTVEGGEFTSFPVAMYVRVVARGAPAPAPGPRDALAQYPFEDAAVFDRPPDGRINRAFTAPPGAYDVYLALAEKQSAETPTPKSVVLKRSVDVPAFQSGLTTSSIIVASEVVAAPDSRRPTFEEQLDHPYVLWGSRMTPATTATFVRNQKLALAFLIYNVTPDGRDKPDVEVRYAFHRITGSTEILFRTTRPEAFNADTLGPAFSLGAGDLVIAGQQVPLSSFPEGEYRLSIQVTDRIASTSITRDVRFSVAGF